MLARLLSISLYLKAVENCPFTFTTDVTTVSSYKQTIPASIRSRMGGVEGSVIDQFGEWEYNYNVYLKNHRGGVTTPTVTLRYGKNITDLEQNIRKHYNGNCTILDGFRGRRDSNTP